MPEMPRLKELLDKLDKDTEPLWGTAGGDDMRLRELRVRFHVHTLLTNEYNRQLHSCDDKDSANFRSSCKMILSLAVDGSLGVEVKQGRPLLSLGIFGWSSGSTKRDAKDVIRDLIDYFNHSDEPKKGLLPSVESWALLPAST